MEPTISQATIAEIKRKLERIRDNETAQHVHMQEPVEINTEHGRTAGFYTVDVNFRHSFFSKGRHGDFTMSIQSNDGQYCTSKKFDF